VKNDGTLGTKQATAGTASGKRDETGDSNEARTANGRRSKGIGKGRGRPEAEDRAEDGNSRFQMVFSLSLPMKEWRLAEFEFSLF
jgi:hypothetical protein